MKYILKLLLIAFLISSCQTESKEDSNSSKDNQQLVFEVVDKKTDYSGETFYLVYVSDTLWPELKRFADSVAFEDDSKYTRINFYISRENTPVYSDTFSVPLESSEYNVATYHSSFLKGVYFLVTKDGRFVYGNGNGVNGW